MYVTVIMWQLDLFSSVSLCKFMYIPSCDIFTSTLQNLKFDCSKSVLKSNKTGGNDGLVGEFFKYGEKRMANLLIGASAASPVLARSMPTLFVCMSSTDLYVCHRPTGRIVHAQKHAKHML